MSLVDDLANIVKNIFFTELLTADKKDLIVNNNLMDQFDDTKERKID